MKYQNTKNPEVLAISFVQVDDKHLELQLEDGSVKMVATSTFKRYWKKVEEEVDKAAREAEQAAAEEAKQIQAEEDKKADEQAVHPVETTKKALKEAAKEARKMQEQSMDRLFKFIQDVNTEMGGEYFIPGTDIKFRSLKIDGKMYCKLNFSGKMISVQIRSNTGAADVITPTKIQNHCFDLVYQFTEDTEDSRNSIRTLLQYAIAGQQAKNADRIKKAADKEAKAAEREAKKAAKEEEKAVKEVVEQTVESTEEK